MRIVNIKVNSNVGNNFFTFERKLAFRPCTRFDEAQTSVLHTHAYWDL